MSEKIAAKHFIICCLNKQEYGLDIKKVVSVERMKTITRVPGTPKYIRGLINLRGEIIPVMDLKIKYGLESAEVTEDARTVIINTSDLSIGIIVDSVAGVLHFPEDSIQNAADYDNMLSMEFISGVGKTGNRIITLLNIEKIVKDD